MATPTEKLAQALEALRDLQDNGMVAIRSRDLSRIHRQRLQKSGFLQEVMKGWYIASRPDELNGESTAWYTSYWDFCASYLNQRFGSRWCISPEHSLLLHAENWSVPKQLLVHSIKGDNKITKLPFETSLLNVRLFVPKKENIELKKKINIFPLTLALIKSSPQFFRQNPTEARIILAMIQDASQVLPALLEEGHTTIAGRLAGGFRNISRDKIADDIVKTMKAAGYEVRENDPFENKAPILLSQRAESPYVNRIRLVWHEMREDVIKYMPPPPAHPLSFKKYIKMVNDKYVTDAYHSLSIEGYRVSIELIELVRAGDWDPDMNDRDKEHKNALAARGYWQAFLAVNSSLEKVLKAKNAGEVAWGDHGNWYRELFGPSVVAGILKPSDLAGYRNNPVYIRRSQHVPPSCEAVRDLMPAFFDLLTNEPEASVRVVLGHFFFVFIHPYMDGNGRMGRFLMNLMCASGGYPWTIVPVEQRAAYMASLEEASVRQNIIPFCKILSKLIQEP